MVKRNTILTPKEEDQIKALHQELLEFPHYIRGIRDQTIQDGLNKGKGYSLSQLRRVILQRKKRDMAIIESARRWLVKARAEQEERAINMKSMLTSFENNLAAHRTKKIKDAIDCLLRYDQMAELNKNSERKEVDVIAEMHEHLKNCWGYIQGVAEQTKLDGLNGGMGYNYDRIRCVIEYRTSYNYEIVISAFKWLNSQFEEYKMGMTKEETKLLKELFQHLHPFRGVSKAYQFSEVK